MYLYAWVFKYRYPLFSHNGTTAVAMCLFLSDRGAEQLRQATAGGKSMGR